MFGTKRGRVHMTSQNLQNLQLRKTKALKRLPGEKSAAASDNDEQVPAKKVKETETTWDLLKRCYALEFIVNCSVWLTKIKTYGIK